MNERRHAGERRSGEAQLRAILDGALDVSKERLIDHLTELLVASVQVSTAR